MSRGPDQTFAECGLRAAPTIVASRVVEALGTEGPLGRRVRSGSHPVLGRGARLPRARPRTSRSRESALSPSRTPFDFAGKLSNVHARRTGEFSAVRRCSFHSVYPFNGQRRKTV